MASKSGVLTVKVIGDAGKFNKTMDGVQGKLGKIGGGIAKVGKAVALGTAAAGAGALALGNEVLNTGAKLTAWRTKTQTVFEGSAGDIRKWADENNETFGVTDDQLAGMAASFGDLLKPMGFTADAAADMSKDVVGLSGALSEWSGGQRSAAEVSDILAKAMLGEREGLKELGISITEAEVQGRLLEKGQKDLTGSALQQAKALATQELIFEKSTDAQAAYAEGGNEALRASNRIKAGLGELREQMTDKLLPIVLKVADWFGEQIPKAMAAIRPVLESVGGAFTTIGRVVAEQVWPRLRDLFSFLMDNKEILVGVAVAIGVGLVAAFSAWAASAAAAAAATIVAVAPVLAIGAAIAALVAGIIWAYQNFDTFRAVVDGVASFLTEVVWPKIQEFAGFIVAKFGELVGWVQAQWGAIQEAISHVINVVAGIIRSTIDVVSALWRAWGDDLANMAATAWAFIRETIENAINLVRSVIQTVLAIINGDWGAAWDGIKGIAAAIWDQIHNVISTAINLVKSTIGGVLSTIGEVWAGAWEYIRDFLGGVWDQIKEAVSTALDAVLGFFRDLPGNIVEAIGDLGSLLLDKGKELVQGFIDGVKSMAGAAASAIASAIPGGGVIGNVLGALPGFASGVRNFSGGMAIVGEKGPELVNLPRGSDVFSNSESRSMMSQGGGDSDLAPLLIAVIARLDRIAGNTRPGDPAVARALAAAKVGA